ncbi:MAG: hypothetical protein KTR25_18215 [Myxococcales bacterium]|nr:hypothetical protein [Myxococcales bacterium]
MSRQFVATIGIWVSLTAAAPTISVAPSSPNPSQDGTVQLLWSSAEPSARYQVEIAAPRSEDGYQLWYEGTATESFVSGLSDGTARFRVRQVSSSDPQKTGWGPWSAILEVEIAHHSMGKALLLLGLGALVFVSIVAYVIMSALRTREELI